eukprot:COSAG05_NODE_1045_length_6054_cov_5.306969_2_plen_579_part_00
MAAKMAGHTAVGRGRDLHREPLNRAKPPRNGVAGEPTNRTWQSGSDTPNRRRTAHGHSALHAADVTPLQTRPTPAMEGPLSRGSLLGSIPCLSEPMPMALDMRTSMWHPESLWRPDAWRYTLSKLDSTAVRLLSAAYLHVRDMQEKAAEIEEAVARREAELSAVVYRAAAAVERGSTAAEAAVKELDSVQTELILLKRQQAHAAQDPRANAVQVEAAKKALSTTTRELNSVVRGSDAAETVQLELANAAQQLAQLKFRQQPRRSDGAHAAAGELPRAVAALARKDDELEILQRYNAELQAELEKKSGQHTGEGRAEQKQGQKREQASGKSHERNLAVDKVTSEGAQGSAAEDDKAEEAVGRKVWDTEGVEEEEVEEVEEVLSQKQRAALDRSLAASPTSSPLRHQEEENEPVKQEDDQGAEKLVVESELASSNVPDTTEATESLSALSDSEDRDGGTRFKVTAQTVDIKTPNTRRTRSKTSGSPHTTGTPRRRADSKNLSRRAEQGSPVGSPIGVTGVGSRGGKASWRKLSVGAAATVVGGPGRFPQRNNPIGTEPGGFRTDTHRFRAKSYTAGLDSS